MRKTSAVKTADAAYRAVGVGVINQCYGLEEHKMKKEGYPVFGTGLTLPDMLKLAESFGVRGYRPTTLDDCGAVCAKLWPLPPPWLKSGYPARKCRIFN